MIIAIFILLVVYQLKHFVADYPLQNGYMLGKFKPGWDFLGPLTAHAGFHGILTFCIALFFTPVAAAIGLAGLDFVLHFTMDRLKAGPKYLGRYKALDATCYPGVLAFAQGKFKELGVQLSPEEEKEKIAWGIQRLKENKYFWWALGLDQMVHHLTHYLIIYIIVIGFLL